MDRQRPAPATKESRIERGILRAISWGAIAVAALLLAGLIVRVTSTLSAPSVSLTELGLTLQGAPVAQDALPPHVEELWTTHSALTVSDLPTGIRWLFACQLILGATLGLGMCLAAFVLPRRLLAGRPFARSAIWSLFVVCVAVLLSGVAAPVLQAMAEAETLQFISGGEIIRNGDTGFSGEGAFVFGVELDLAPFGIALGLAALLAAYEAGSRLQKDTEGLV